jgi:hypothetical protein
MLYPKRHSHLNRSLTRAGRLTLITKSAAEKKKDLIEKFSSKFDILHHKRYDIGKMIKALHSILENSNAIDKFDFDRDFDSLEAQVSEKLSLKRNSGISLKIHNSQLLPIVQLTDSYSDNNAINPTHPTYRINTTNGELAKSSEFSFNKASSSL